jgi:H+/Cl- antiporter ClcA
MNKVKLFFKDLAKWMLIILAIGVLVGVSSALFLISLDWITNVRESHFEFIYFLPLAGFLVAFLYHKWGKDVAGGNKLILSEYESPKKIIPLKMAPLIYCTTLITHLFGGSAGREGTAIQLSSSISDQFSTLLKLNEADRRILLLCAIAAGFSSIFGTPFAGFIFAFEIVVFRKLSLKGIIPIFACSFLANQITLFCGASHTNYFIKSYYLIDFNSFGWTILVGILFGLCALLFVFLMRILGNFFQKQINFPPLRTFIAGIVLVSLVFLLGNTKYLGLGISGIVDSFQHPAAYYDFLLKIVFTVITLSAGFKGGEVTPLFFIGAVFGSYVSTLIGLPLEISAAIGFVAVFAGATKTPIASSILGMEIFGYQHGIYFFTACFVAVLFSGNYNIYGTKYWSLFTSIKSNKMF